MNASVQANRDKLFPNVDTFFTFQRGQDGTRYMYPKAGVEFTIIGRSVGVRADSLEGLTIKVLPPLKKARDQGGTFALGLLVRQGEERYLTFAKLTVTENGDFSISGKALNPFGLESFLPGGLLADVFLNMDDPCTLRVQRQGQTMLLRAKGDGVLLQYPDGSEVQTANGFCNMLSDGKWRRAPQKRERDEMQISQEVGKVTGNTLEPERMLTEEEAQRKLNHRINVLRKLKAALGKKYPIRRGLNSMLGAVIPGSERPDNSIPMQALADVLVCQRRVAPQNVTAPESFRADLNATAGVLNIARGMVNHEKKWVSVGDLVDALDKPRIRELLK